MIPHIIVDGTIACGKSTVLRGLQDWFTVQPEPVEKWKKLLDSYYTDPAKYAHALNMTCLNDVSRRDSDEGVSRSRLVVSERSIHSSFHIFGSITREQGLLNKDEFRELSERYHELCKVNPRLNDTLYIFIDVPVDVAIHRMVKRNRSEVLSGDISYFVKLISRYRQFYQLLTDCGARVVTIRGDQSEDFVLFQVKKAISVYAIDDKKIPLVTQSYQS
jgi:deoxyadenosine/deoxycytidine kinase